MDLADARVFGRALGAIARLQAGLTQEQREWLAAVPVRLALDAVDLMPERTGFSQTSPELEAVDAAVSVECDPDWTGAYWNLVLLHLVVQRLERGWPFALTAHVHRALLRELERIAVECETNSPPSDPLGDDDFLLDFGFAVGRLVSFDFALLMAPAQLPSGDDDRPWIAVHINGRQPQGAADWEAWLEEIPPAVEFFRANPQFGGMFGVGWISDPQVGEISPHLAFVRQMMLEGGATIEPVGSTHAETIEHATSTSNARRQSYEAGAWTPSHYFLRWPMENFLPWASAFEAPA